jgi:Allene oxide cyclase barrel like domain
MRFVRSRRVVGSVSAVALIAASIVVLPGAASAQAKSSCITHYGLKDHSHVTPVDLPPAGPSNGDLAYYHDELYDASGKQLGTLAGKAVLYWENDDWRQVHVGTETLKNGGKIFYTGTLSIAEMVGGGSATWPVIGLSGPYANKVGTHTFSFFDRTDIYNPIFNGDIKMCTVGPDIS